MRTIGLEDLGIYVPKESLPTLFKWFNQRTFHLIVKKKRSSKLGDFRAPSKKPGLPTITINSNLNKYAFLITLTHEFAHLLVWYNHDYRVKAHGKEWKEEFSILLTVLINKNIFPEPISELLKKHSLNPKAASGSDVDLTLALRKYDSPRNTFLLSEITDGSSFRLNNNRVFTKGRKKRTRYLCKENSTGREYLIHGIAEVLPN